jgi:tetratricopeptide (TPR) repeat protein
MNAHSRRRTLDFRYLTLFVVLALLVGGGMHALHGYQVRRNAAILLEQANLAEADGDTVRFADYLTRYVGFNPTDLDAAARYGLFVDQRSKSPPQKYRAFMILEDVLRRDPTNDRPEVRRRAAELAIALRRPADARAHLERLLQGQSGNAELEDLLGQCEEESKQFDKARTAYETALKHAPTRMGTAFRLARLVRGPLNPAPDLDKANDANRVMDALVEAAPDSLDAHMFRCKYLQSVGNLDAAEKDLAYLRDKLAPDNVDVILTSAEVAELRHRFEEARKHLERGRKKFPEDGRFSMALARIELRVGNERKPAAAEQLRETLKSAPNDLETLWTIADLFIDAGDLDDARKLMTRLPTLNAPPAALDFLNARLLAASGKTGEAVDSLERCRAGGTAREGMSFLNHKMNLLLARWYDELNNPDQQLAACERVLHDDALSLQARVGKASALAKLGRTDEALAIYRTLLGDLPALRVNVARLLLTRDLRLPAGQRNPGEVERMLSGLPAEIKERPEYRLLLIDYLAVANRWDEAEAEAVKACKDSPKEVRYWMVRSALAERKPKPDRAKALAVLDEAQAQLGDAVELRLARAYHAAEQPLTQSRATFRKLEGDADHFSAVDRAKLEAGLSNAYYRLGDSAEALRLMGLAVSRVPSDLGYRQQYFDLAVLVGDDAVAAKQVEELRHVEGEEGVLWRYEDAARHVQAAHKGDTAALKVAQQQLTEVANRRPNWSRRLVLEGEIAEIEGRTDLALEDYQKAIERGERSKRVIRRAVQFLANRRRTDEARQLLQKVLEQSPTNAGDLNRMLVEVSIPDNQSKQQSLEMVRAAVSPTTKDYRELLWLGQVLASLGEKKEAEEAIRKAVAMRESSPEVWIALVTLLAETGRTDEAKAELNRSQHVLAEPLRPSVLARGREVLGHTQEAESVYLDILKARPNDSGAKRATASFYLRTGQSTKAEPILRDLSAGEGGDNNWARRTLALSLAVTGDYRKTREALEMLDKNLGGGHPAPEDHRARALVLALRPGGRQASIQTMEESFLQVKPMPAEEFLLAQLYDADGNWTKANERFLSLCSRPGATPEILGYYIRALLRHDQAGNARVLLGKLEALEPRSPLTAELKARLLKEENKGDEAGRLLNDFARTDFALRKDPQTLLVFARMLDDIGRPVESEALYRLCVAETEKTRPESLLALASFMAVHNRMGEAFDLCEKAAEHCPAEKVATVFVGSLRLGEPTEADRKRVQDWLEGALRKKPESVYLLVAQADLLDACGDYEGSVRTYRDLLERNPKNVLALNNLAWLLAVHNRKGEEALKLIDQAIEIVGPVGDLLDTQASVYLVLGQADEAIKRLEEARQQGPTATRLFHLTQAYEKAGRRDAAKDAWIKATKEMSLKEKSLHPLERADFKRFNANLTTDNG